MGDTVRALREVLQQRSEFRNLNIIAGTRHVLADEERAEMVRVVRETQESTADHQRLQEHDRRTHRTELEGKACGTGKGSGTSHVGGDAEPTKLGIVAKHIREKKRGRWCLHLQRVCGTTQT